MRRRRGFTLVELVTSMTITATVSLGAVAVLREAVEANQGVLDECAATARASVALRRVVEELREIPSKGPGPDIATLTPTSVVWGDGRELRLSGKELLFTEAGEQPAVLCSPCESFRIAGIGPSGLAVSATPGPAEIATITRLSIELTVIDGAGQRTLRTRVFPRALTREVP